MRNPASLGNRRPIRIREIGRYAQEYIEYAMSIENREERQLVVEKIVDMLVDINAPSRNGDDYRTKVWAHLMEISDYKLDVTPPMPIPPRKTTTLPAPVPYPKYNKSYRYYGQNIHGLIERAKTLDEFRRDEFLSVVASYMKLSYKTWNNDDVTDEIIAEDFNIMSKGELNIPLFANLDSLVHSRKDAPNQQSNKKRNFKKQRNNNNNNNNNNNRKRGK